MCLLGEQEPRAGPHLKELKPWCKAHVPPLSSMHRVLLASCEGPLCFFQMQQIASCRACSLLLSCTHNKTVLYLCFAKQCEPCLWLLLLLHHAGGIIPTDTLPALVADLENRDAVARLYQIKELD